MTRVRHFYRVTITSARGPERRSLTEAYTEEDAAKPASNGYASEYGVPVASQTVLVENVDDVPAGKKL